MVVSDGAVSAFVSVTLDLSVTTVVFVSTVSGGISSGVVFPHPLKIPAHSKAVRKIHDFFKSYTSNYIVLLLYIVKAALSRCRGIILSAILSQTRVNPQCKFFANDINKHPASYFLNTVSHFEYYAKGQ